VQTLPRATRQIGAWIEQTFEIVYESRSGLNALLHRRGLDYHAPDVIPCKLDVAKQDAFIKHYENFLNGLGDDEAVVFVDAVHSAHAARPVACGASPFARLQSTTTGSSARASSAVADGFSLVPQPMRNWGLLAFSIDSSRKPARLTPCLWRTPHEDSIGGHRRRRFRRACGLFGRTG
jgi:hypothetical protein